MFYRYEDDISGQVKQSRCRKGQVVLVGNTGYYPSPPADNRMGVTTELVGCYVLAREMIEHRETVDACLQGYERVIGPLAAQSQSLRRGMPKLQYHEMTWET